MQKKLLLMLRQILWWSGGPGDTNRDTVYIIVKYIIVTCVLLVYIYRYMRNISLNHSCMRNISLNHSCMHNISLNHSCMRNIRLNHSCMRIIGLYLKIHVCNI